MATPARNVTPLPGDHGDAAPGRDPRLRFVTAASLFDGHDASINIMQRILKAEGAEVIHLGHNRSVEEVVTAAVQEDAHAIAVISYQGGHVEYFRYMLDMLRERGRGDVRIFGGGGGVIVADEIQALHDHGISRIYSPQDGQEMGLKGRLLYHPVRAALTGAVQGPDVPDVAYILGRVTTAERLAAGIGATDVGEA